VPIAPNRSNLVTRRPIRQHTAGMADNSNLPLVVDLDGTLIRTDLMWESLARLLRRNPLAIFQILAESIRRGMPII